MHLFAQAAFLFAASLLGSSASAGTVSRRASVCNGYSELCSKTFGNVTFVGAHDSYAVDTGNIGANQDYNVTTQLNDGIRMLQVQAHTSNGVIHLCHTSCAILDSGSFADYLTAVKSWLDANPNEVISILIVNIETLAPSAYASVYQSVGLDTLSYSPPSSSLASNAWPTLGELIDQGKRVISFMDYNADFSSVPYLIDEFSNVWETAYDVTDQTFNCEVNRTGSADNKMYLINHFLDKDTTILGLTFPTPNKDLLNETNALSGTGSLGLQAEQCGAQYSKYPTFMLVDFYNWGGGSVFEVAADLNAVTYVSKSVSPPLTATDGGSSSTSTPSSRPNTAMSAGHSAGFAVAVMIASSIMGALLVV